MIKTIVVVLALLTSSAFASTYYVSPCGNDSNNGTTITTPFLTVQKAANTVAAGDTVNITPGTYLENVTVTTNGTSGSPITFQGTTPAAVVQKFVLNGNYCTVKNLTINNAALSVDSDNTHSSALLMAGNNNTVSNCTITLSNDGTSYGFVSNFDGVVINGNTNTLTGCTLKLIPGGRAWVVIGGNSNTISNNLMYGGVDADVFNGWGDSNTITGNEIRNFTNPGVNTKDHADFFQTWGFSGVVCTNYVISNNYVHDCDIQIGNTENDGHDSTMHDMTFKNNVFANITSSFFSGLHNTFFYNNLFYKCGSVQSQPVILYGVTNYNSNGDILDNNALVMCGNDPANNSQGAWGSNGFNLATVTVDHNFYCGTAYAAKSSGAGAQLGTNSVNGGNPLYQSESGEDFHITCSSPIIAQGLNLTSTFTTDKDGYTRQSTGGWDIGPYLFMGPTPGAPPAGIALVQHTHNTAHTNGTSIAQAFGSNIGTGNCLVAVVSWFDTTRTVSSISDTKGSTWVQAGTVQQFQGCSLAVYYTTGGTVTGADTVTVNFAGGSAVGPNLSIAEYSGVATTTPLDGTSASNGSSGNSSSGAITTTNAKDLLVGAGITNNDWSTATVNFTIRDTNDESNGDFLEDYVTSATGSYSSAPGPNQNAGWVLRIIALHP